jgi:arylsulfatase A-like enzyme
MLAVSAWQLYSQNRALLATAVVEAAAREMMSSRVVIGRVAAFAVAQIALHALLAIGVWLVSWLLLRAFPTLEPRRRAVFWFVAIVIFSAVLLQNAAMFPWSIPGTGVRWLATVELGHLPVADLVASTALMLAIVALGGTMWRSPRRKLWIRSSVWLAVIGGVAAVLSNMPRSAADTPKAAHPPNVIIIGIDSLRVDTLGLAGRLGYTPQLQKFLGESHVFLDVTTPLARTFPSWTTLLSGRSPVRTNARDNLVPIEHLNLGDTLPVRLRGLGYKTYYATDEVRFANIDERYGFDVTITPRIGVSDFVLGEFNDIPLANLMSGTRLARWLFPDSYANRAAARIYRPETFVDHVDDRFDPQGPTFLALHLTLPHWPYHWADRDDAIFADTSDMAFAYLASLIEADRQFAEIMMVLRDKGVLDNALVFVMSDHGEALQTASDNLLLSPEAKRLAGKIPVWMNGHGTSVLSPHQYNVLLAARGFGAAGVAPRGTLVSDVGLSLEDVTPTVLELLGVTYPPAEFDGMSFASRLRADPPAADTLAASTRVRFTETAFSPMSLQKGDMNVASLLKDDDRLWLFGVNRANGRFEARMDRWPKLLVLKERAAIGTQFVLAAIPAPQGHKYVLVPRRGGLPVRLLGEPDSNAGEEPQRLWRALHERFPGELGPAVAD